MSVYLLLYLIIIILMVLDRLNKCKNIKFLTLTLNPPKTLATFILIVFSGIRDHIGWDYYAYYDAIVNSTQNVLSSRGEILNMFLINISRVLGSPLLYFFITSLFTTGLIMLCVYRYSNGFWMGILLYLSIPLFYINSMSVIRFFVALSLTLYGIKFIVNRNLLKFILTIFIASLFHESSLIALSFYFIYKIRINTILVVFILILSRTFSEVANQIIIKFYKSYDVYTEVISIVEGTKAIYVFMVFTILVLIVRKFWFNDDDFFIGASNIYILGMFIYLIFYSQGTLSHRLSLYGTIYIIILLPYIIDKINNNHLKSISEMAIYSFCLLSYIYALYVGAETLIPYKTLLNI